MSIGSIKQIVRYPVKSFAGEYVEKTQILNYGLYGDRSHAYLDQTRDGKFLTVTQLPEMVRYQAKFIGPESLEGFPAVEVSTRDGKYFSWDNPELINELEQLTTRSISTIQYSPTHVPLGAIEVENILLVSAESLIELAEIWGRDVDARRFRPNLVLDLCDKGPFFEEEWIGKKISIGKHVILEVNKHCERCMIVTVDPDSATKDPSLLKTIASTRKNHFGVYAKVIQTGDIQIGDDITFID